MLHLTPGLEAERREVLAIAEGPGPDDLDTSGNNDFLKSTPVETRAFYALQTRARLKRHLAQLSAIVEGAFSKHTDTTGDERLLYRALLEPLFSYGL